MIRRAGVEDIFEVAVMAKNFESHTEFVFVDPEYTTKKYTELMNNGSGIMFVIEKDGKIVGGIGGLIGPDLHSPRMIAVETFWFVLPEYRGKGFKLLNEFEKWADEKKADAVAMVHLVDCHPDILEKIYKRKGYQLIENHYLKVLR